MRTPDQIRGRLTTTWRGQWTDWLGDGGSWPKDFSLDAPTEREAQRLWPEFTRWIATWLAAPLGGEMVTATRAWRSMGRQSLPTHVRFGTPAEFAAAMGRSTAELFAVADRRWRDRTAAWPDLASPLRACSEWLAGLSDADYERFVAVVDWLSEHRDTGLYMRQLPIPGLDTKWVETHAGPIARLLAARFGCAPGPLTAVAGLASDRSRRRIRLLDPLLRAQVAGLSDISVRIDELATLDLPVRVAIVIENQQTALACGDVPGGILLMGGGFSVAELGRVPWLERVPLVYWGDIDTAGLAILNTLRAWHPHTVACLMDEATLLSHRDLWSWEQKPTPGVFAHLTPPEMELHAKLARGHWQPGVRLEQERLGWPLAWKELCAKVHVACAEPPSM